MPDTSDVYVVPDIDVDLFFWNGWWWRPWEGRWYRSYYYDRGWVHYDNVPSFYFDVDPGWRGYYRNHDWHGHRWDYERIPDRRLHKNWKSWHANRYWERQKTWGVQGYRPQHQQQRQELRHQRQGQYQQRPEVQKHQQYRQEQIRQYQQKHPQGGSLRSSRTLNSSILNLGVSNTREEHSTKSLKKNLSVGKKNIENRRTKKLPSIYIKV